MADTKILALDIGGANLKAADGHGFATSRFFPLWQKPQELSAALRSLVADSPQADTLAVTMTGELADCFQTKAEGVAQILAAVMQAAGERRVLVYATDGRLLALEEACRAPLAVAAANWHALARFAGRLIPRGTALLIDLGSTTCDLIPLFNGQPVATAATDPERLASGELVYTGVIRSPVCAIVSALPWRGRQVPVAQEMFATMYDVYLALGDLPENAGNRHTADGRPALRTFARDRLARQICADRTMFDDRDAQTAAASVARTQLSRIAIAAQTVLGRLPGPPASVVTSGQGEFVARRLLNKLAVNANIISLAERLGPVVSQAATAHALAELVRDELQQRPH
ncbi:MAG TPA: hydantoinase/oxoprolinase family protein [Pirellulales bacterium]|nr:hydantoinase/oxoprolinase family protein [Pirellulales bacterium]